MLNLDGHKGVQSTSMRPISNVPHPHPIGVSSVEDVKYLGNFIPCLGRPGVMHFVSALCSTVVDEHDQLRTRQI